MFDTGLGLGLIFISFYVIKGNNFKYSVIRDVILIKTGLITVHFTFYMTCSFKIRV